MKSCVTPDYNLEMEEDLKVKLFDSLLTAYCLSSDTIKAWGEEAQVNKTIEECAELIVALQHSRSRTLDVRTVASEVADVLVMTMCVARIVGVEVVSDEMNRKLSRLKGRLDTAKPPSDLEEKYNKAVQTSTEMESRYYKELARSEELRRQLLEIQSFLPAVNPDDEAVVDGLLAKNRQNVRKRKLSKRKK